jgi:hypothetical protein
VWVEAERAGHVGQTLIAIQLHLGYRVPCPDQHLLNGNIEVRTDRRGEEKRLVISSATQFVRVQGHGNDRIELPQDVQNWEHQLSQVRRPAPLVGIFK